LIIVQQPAASRRGLERPRELSHNRRLRAAGVLP
jgi:hypothetical protein